MTPPPRNYWPTIGWRHADPVSQGFNTSVLAEAVRFVHDFNMGGGRKLASGAWAIHRRATAMLVVRGGYLVSEEYWGAVNERTLHDIESGGKSIASILCAHAIHAGHFSLDTKITDLYTQLVPLNPEAASGPLQVKHAISMAGGLNVTSWQVDSPAVPPCVEWNHQFRRGPPGQPAFVASHGILKRPGVEFSYSFANTGLMSGVMSRATNLSYAAYAAARLFPKLGIRTESWRWLGDREGNTEGDGDSYHTARNYAKLAYLMLNGGAWAGEQLLDPEYVRGAGEPTPHGWSNCAEYSHFFWRKPLEGVPRDTFYAWGGGGQFAVVVPSLDLVVVTLYGGILSRWVAPDDVAQYSGREFFPTADDVIAKTRDGDGLCAGAHSWNFTAVASQPPPLVTAEPPASEVPGGTGCSNGETRGDLLTGMMQRIVASIEE